MREIKLTKNKVALIDDKDYDYINQWKWCANKMGNTYYAVRDIWVNKKVIILYMHRVLLDVIDSEILIDHMDHNGLNNQRNNLRTANKRQNQINMKSHADSTSKYLGVHWFKSRNKWCVKIKTTDKVKHIGYFNCEIEAAKAYNLAAINIHGEFANLNPVKDWDL